MIKKLYLFQILSGMFFFVPIITPFWVSYGLTKTEIMLLQSIFSITVVILEIPTGYISDRYGRKTSLILASIAGVLTILILGVGTNFWQFAISEVMFAINVSLISGTTSALVYDTLLEEGREAEYKHIWGSLVFVKVITIGIANILSGYMIIWGLKYVVLASAPFFLLMVPVALSFREPKYKKVVSREGYTGVMIKNIITTLKKETSLKWLLIYSGLLYSIFQMALYFYTPYFTLTGVDKIYIGVIFGLFQFFSATTSKLSPKLQGVLGGRNVLISLIFILSISYLLMGYVVTVWGFLFCFIHQFVRGLKVIVISTQINNMVESSHRATMLSVESFIGRLFYALTAPLYGWIVDVYSLLDAFKIIGFSSLLVGVIILVMHRRTYGTI